MPSLNLTIDGNSISALTNPGYIEYIPSLLDNRLTPLTIRNFAVSGQGSTAMAADASTQIDIPLHINADKNVLFGWEGTNDLRITLPDAEFAKVVSYCNNRRAYGFKVGTATTLPRTLLAAVNTIPVINVADFEARRLIFNNLLRANPSSYCDFLVDLAAIPEIGDLSASTNLLYYYDGCHLAAKGGQVVANAIAKSINEYLIPTQQIQQVKSQYIRVSS